MPRVTASVARSCLALPLTLLALFGASLAWAGPMAGSINFTLGGRQATTDWNLSDPSVTTRGDTLHNTVKQPSLGVEVALAPAGWPVQIAADVLYSADDGVRSFHENQLFDIRDTDLHRRASLLEIGLGVRRAWSFKGLSPYVGAGGSWFRADLVSELIDPAVGRWGELLQSTHGRHSAMGFWYGGGLYRHLGPRFQMGITGRFSKAKMVFPERGDVRGHQGGYSIVPHKGTDKLEVGGRHIGLVVGWSFPTRK